MTIEVDQVITIRIGDVEHKMTRADLIILRHKLDEILGHQNTPNAPAPFNPFYPYNPLTIGGLCAPSTH